MSARHGICVSRTTPPARTVLAALVSALVLMAALGGCTAVEKITKSKGNAKDTPRKAPARASRTDGSAQGARHEVAAAIRSWIASTEQRDIYAHVGHYAQDMERYYGRTHVSRDIVFQDRQRAFDKFPYIDINMRNLALDFESPTRVRATFNKTWDLRGDTRTAGEVRAELILIKISGEWKITSENDVEVIRMD